MGWHGNRWPHGRARGAAAIVCVSLAGLLALGACDHPATTSPSPTVDRVTTTAPSPTTDQVTTNTEATTNAPATHATTASQPPAARATSARTYNGSAEVTLTTYDNCGPGFTREATGTQTYSLSTQLVVSDPKSDASSTEPNPFSIMLTAGNPAAAGAISLASALVVTTSGSDLAGNFRDPRLLLTYWQLEYSGSQLSGRLIDTHVREGAVYNLFNEVEPIIPCRPGMGNLPALPMALDVGATLQGTLTTSTANLTLTAATTDGLASFRLHFTS